MKCPKCKVSMLVVERDEVELDYCTRCEGLWFDHGELALLFQELGPAAHGLLPQQIAALPAAKTDEPEHRCPICRAKMRKILLGPAREVLIDACPHGDGLWFDREEVALLAREIIEASSEVSAKAVAFLRRVFPERNPSGLTEGETE